MSAAGLVRGATGGLRRVRLSKFGLRGDASHLALLFGSELEALDVSYCALECEDVSREVLYPSLTASCRSLTVLNLAGNFLKGR